MCEIARCILGWPQPITTAIATPVAAAKSFGTQIFAKNPPVLVVIGLVQLLEPSLFELYCGGLTKIKGCLCNSPSQQESTLLQ